MTDQPMRPRDYESPEPAHSDDEPTQTQPHGTGVEGGAGRLPEGAHARLGGVVPTAAASSNVDAGWLDGLANGGQAHSHSHAHGPAPRASRGVRIVLAVLLIPMLLASAIGMVVYWPKDPPEPGALMTTAPGATIMLGTVTGPLEDEGIPVRVDDEFGGGEIVIQIGGEYASVGIDAGDRVRFQEIPVTDSDTVYVFQDFERRAPIGIMAAGYALLVVLVARWRGFASIIGLVVSFLVIVKFTLPALWTGADAIPIALVTSIVVMFFVLYVAHGFTTRTSTALLGTIIGLAVTVLLAAWAVESTNIVMLDDYLVQLNMLDERVSVRSIVLCGMVLAGLGVLNDVTITQASAVWELKTVNPQLGVWELFSRGMRIGRDHIASTVYTITFAYLGAALPMLMLVSLIDQGLWFTLTSGEIAVEVVRTLIGSIGLVLAIPITTFLGALVLTLGRQENAAVEGEERAEAAHAA